MSDMPGLFGVQAGFQGPAYASSLRDGTPGRTAVATAEPAGCGLLCALLNRQIAETDALRRLLCGLTLPILEVGPDLRLQFFNPAAEIAVGIGAADLGTSPAALARLAPVSDLAEVCRSGEPHERAACGPTGKDWLCQMLPHTHRDTSGRGVIVLLLARPTTSPAALPQVMNHGLTLRQREILRLVLAGHPSKNIAADLHISQRTVENHRAAIMRRTGATSLPGLARLAMGADLAGDRKPTAPRSRIRAAAEGVAGP